jgi:DnaK suppressor protein
VEQAKQKILSGTYGECEDCSSDISQSRLLARPTAGLCINCQEEKERSEFGTFKKRRDLTSKKYKEESEFDHIVTRPKFNTVSEIAFESVVDG